MTVPRQQVKKTYFTFVGGLNTEAGYLTFPANMWKEGFNVIPQFDASLEARTAMNFEHGFVLSANEQTQEDKETSAYTVHSWQNVALQNGLSFAVVQRGQFLYVYDDTGFEISTTEKGAAYVVDLNTYKAPLFEGVVGQVPIQAVAVMGRLIITSAAIDPFIMEDDSGTGLIITPLSLRFRDFEGVEDNLQDESVDVTPSTLSTAHNYNLINQGWNAAQIGSFFGVVGLYPSNAQQWFVGKDTNDDFSPALLQKQDFGKGHAPKGRMILDVFLQNRDAASGLAGVGTNVVQGRPATCAFFAGRAWYAGIANSTLNAWVLFSQVVLSNANLGQCYQSADPTSEQQSDLVASDGGVIVVQGAGNIIKLVPMGNSIVVIADNGVWSINGGGNAGFSADLYEIRQITKIGAISALNIVETESNVLYWSNEGIWAIGADNQTGLLDAKNVTFNTVSTFYQNIDPLARLYAAGKYHQQDRKIYWLYQDVPNTDGLTNRFKKDRMLVLDTRLNAFYAHSISQLTTDSPEVVCPHVTSNSISTLTDLNVVDNTDVLVVDALDEQVILSTLIGSSTKTGLKFLTVTPSADWSATFSEWEDGTVQAAKFKDWYSKDSVGKGYVPYILTGYDLGAGQGGDRKLQTNYITALMKRTETGIDSGGAGINQSSVSVTARWHFTDDGIANKWSQKTQIYRHRRLFVPPIIPSSTYVDGFPVLVAKHKLRGRGNAFQLKFEGEAGFDFKLIGWSIPVLNNAD